MMSYGGIPKCKYYWYMIKLNDSKDLMPQQPKLKQSKLSAMGKMRYQELVHQ